MRFRFIVGHYAVRRLGNRADRRTCEARAQELALLRGWIKSVPPGSGCRVVIDAGEPTSAVEGSAEGR